MLRTAGWYNKDITCNEGKKNEAVVTSQHG